MGLPATSAHFIAPELPVPGGSGRSLQTCNLLRSSKLSADDTERVIAVNQRVCVGRGLVMLFVPMLLSISSMVLFFAPVAAMANPSGSSQGEVLFDLHCAGCHLNGGNIIRRRKTLKLAALERNGIVSSEAIAQIARQGIGRMSGYGDVLGPDGDRIVAEWIWQQAQKAWIQG